MGGMIPALAIVVILMGGILGAMMILGRKKGGIKKSGKDRGALFKQASKRLSQNPRDPEGLSAMGEIYFTEQSWDKAYQTYSVLLEVLATGPVKGIDEFEVNLRYGTSAKQLDLLEDALKGFSVARGMRPDNFEANYNLGVLEFQRKNYEKTIQLLQQALKLDSENAAALRTMGHAFFRLKKNREAMTFIRKAIDLAPDDKESLYTLGECYYEAGQTDQALRVFGHLRGDPVMGASACLVSGTINAEIRQYDLRLVQDENPNFRDVGQLIGRYQELNSNRNLQVFIMAPSADFVALCRKVVIHYFAKAKTKITNISVHKNEWADILAEVDSPKWSDVIMFRFIRTQGSIGELIVRDFHSHLKEVKAGKGICITVGTFSEEAKRYTEARLIDLIEKDKLAALLNSVDSRQAAAVSKKK